MGKKYLVDDDETNVLAKLSGLPYKVDISPELMNLLKPNEFLKGLGVRYLKRIKTILKILKGNLIPNKPGKEETVPKEGVVFPIAVVKGPFIKEETVSIRAVLKDDGIEPCITLNVVHEVK